uniref:Uncharacterized protein n=1 Tax=Lygus hesperus TaxID=30085 RepID=A0A146M8N4_LYGHE
MFQTLVGVVQRSYLPTPVVCSSPNRITFESVYVAGYVGWDGQHSSHHPAIQLYPINPTLLRAGTVGVDVVELPTDVKFIHLEFDSHIRQFFFPGQVVLLKGINPTGTCFHVNACWCSGYESQPHNHAQDEKVDAAKVVEGTDIQGSILCVQGPFIVQCSQLRRQDGTTASADTTASAGTTTFEDTVTQTHTYPVHVEMVERALTSVKEYGKIQTVIVLGPLLSPELPSSCGYSYHE